MKKSIKGKYIIVIIFFLLVLLGVIGYHNFLKSYRVVSNKIDTIPFRDRNFTGSVTTNICIDNDTLDFVVDTGADNFLINSTLLKSKKLQSNKKVTQKVTDAIGYTGKLERVRIKKLEWGSIKIKNSPTFIYDKTKINLIGNDLLSQFCVKFDNEYQRIILSKKSSLIPKKGFQIPLLRKGNFFYIPVTLSKSKKPIYFLLDTGFEGGFSFEYSVFQSLKLPENKKQKWINSRGETLFSSKKSDSKDSIVSYSFIDFKIGKKTFKNVIIDNSITNRNVNIVGSFFLSRFRSFTIDYPNKVLYLELPKDYFDTQYNVNMIFSKDTISNVTIPYLSVLYSYINSFGIITSYNSPYLVKSFNVKYKDKIDIGDTLVGINNTIFYKNIYDTFFVKKSNFKIVNNPENQSNILFKTLNRESSVDFYFLKNQKLVKVKAIRDTLLNPPPQIAYGCYDTKGEIPYFITFSSTFIKKDRSTFSIHYPYSTLTGKEIEIKTYYDKEHKKQIFTNKPK